MRTPLVGKITFDRLQPITSLPSASTDITGRVLGKLRVLEPAGILRTHPKKGAKMVKPYSGLTWLCSCECGNYKIIRASVLLSGGAVSCGIGCGLDKGSANRNWKGVGELSGLFYSRLASSSARRGLLLQVSMPFLWDLFLRQHSKCALTGRILTLAGKRYSASLDRIDSATGYTETNVQWVHKDINSFHKRDIPNDTFIAMSCAVAETRGLVWGDASKLVWTPTREHTRVTEVAVPTDRGLVGVIKYDQLVPPRPDLFTDHRFTNRTGSRIGEWTVVELAGTRGKDLIWLCRCSCGNSKLVPASSLSTGSATCGYKVHKKGGSKSVLYKGEGALAKEVYNVYKYSARARDLPFEVSISYLWTLFVEQECKCAFTGVDIGFPERFRTQKKLRTASLDRVNSVLGYVEGNVQWVHRDINKYKSNIPNDKFLAVCEEVARHHGMIDPVADNKACPC